MTLTRRRFLASSSTVLISAPAWGQQSFPSQDIRQVCAFPPGSGADILHRHFATRVAPLAGVSVLVENRPGASGNLAQVHVARSKPDGYTIYMGSGTTMASSLHLFKQPPIDPLKDFEFVCSTLMQGFVITVDAKSPFQTLKDLTIHLKEKKSKASYGATNVPGVVLAELYKQHEGLEATLVNYRSSGDFVNDLLGGNLDFSISDIIFALSQRAKGSMRILGIGLKDRMQSIPDIPTLEEQGIKGIDLPVWWLVACPAGTPKPIVAKIGSWYDQVQRSDDTKKFYLDTATDHVFATSEETRARVELEIKRWGEFIKTAKIEPT